MNTYYMMWAYLGNYSDKPMALEGLSPEDALRTFKKYSIYGKDFWARATIFIYEQPPTVFTSEDLKALEAQP